MRTVLSKEVFVSNLQSLNRVAAVAAVLLAGAAVAQAPANDLCTTAQSVTPVVGDVVTTAAVNISAAATGVEDGFSCGGASPTNSVWYTFVAPRTGPYTLSSCTISNFDTILQVYTGTCGALAQVTSACNDDGCSPQSRVTLSLLAGETYYVQIAAYSATSVTATSVAGFNLTTPPLPPPNDSCSGTVPSLTVDLPLTFSTNVSTANDSIVGGPASGAGTCFVGLGHSTSATLNPAPGRDVVFRFVPPSTATYSVRVGSPSASINQVLYMTDSCVDAMTPPQTYAPPQCIAAANRLGSSSTGGEELVCIPLTSGTPVFLWADEGAQSTAGATFDIEVTQCVMETEPNDEPATASPLACPVTGGVTPAGELDYFDLGTPPAGSRAFAMVEASTSGSSGSVTTSFDLRVTTATDTLEFDDSDLDTAFGGLSGAVAGTPLTGAQSYLRVNQSSGTVLTPYRLYSVVQTGTPTAEAEPNDTVAAANVHASNYFSGVVSATTDVDLFAFDARAGDVVFLSLDAQPSRTGSTSTGNHTLQLLDLSGAAVVAVNDSNTTVNNSAFPGMLDAGYPRVPSESLVYRIHTTGAYLARVGRTSSTGSGEYQLSISTRCGVGGGILAPTLASINPATGTVLGQTTVTLSGGSFSAGAEVRFGSSLGTVVNRTSSTIEVLTPTGSEGVVDVSVTNPGSLVATLPNSFTYFAPIAPPTITSVLPATGPTAGGTVITVVGTLFKAGAEVTLTVGGVPQAATNVIIDNATQLRATTPAHVGGVASLTVRNPVDALEGTRPAAFTYLAPPAITSISPNSGLTSGGLTVTLQGTAFRDGAIVRFGANAGTAVTVDPSGTSLTVETPTSAIAAAVDVTVVNTDTQQTVATGGFTYAFPAPTIATVEPAQGYAVGGDTITITGTGFQANPTVTVGGTPATNVSRSSLTQLTAVTPAGTPGPADVVVTNSDAQAVTSTGAFRYVAAPNITAISPANGPVQGGTRITITGQDFQAGATLRLGGVPAFAVDVTSATTATAVTNANLPGVVDVVLTNPDDQVSTLTGGFTYDGAPSLVSLSPITGTTAGGTLVTLTGAGFNAGTTVRFGATAATGVTLVSPTELTALTPARAVGVVSVSVQNADGQSAELPRSYRFVAPPTLASVAPSTGDVAGGTEVRLTGTGFSAGSTVTFGGSPSPAVTLLSATELAAIAPAHAPGAVDLVVTTDGASATLTGGFTYTRGAPTLTAVAPPSGPLTGGTLLTLSGSNFGEGATITVGGAAATDVVIVSSVLARAVVPAHPAGVVDVVFTNDDAQAVTLAGAFTYVAAPNNEAGTVSDGGSGGIGEGPVGGGGGAGGVSCGCSSFDASTFSLAGMGLLLVLSRRRRRS